MKLEMISRYPAGRRHHTPLLFIHGMFHGAWCWDVHFLGYFVQQGFVTHAVNLRGHGNSEGRKNLRWTKIAEFVEDVSNAVQQLSTAPILIGHSLGGFVIQKYLEDHNVPGAVLLSSPPPSGLLRTALRIAKRRPLVFAKVNLTLNMQPMIARPELVGEAFFSPEFPYEELLIYWKQMQNESYRALWDMVLLNRPNPAKIKTPMLVLGAERDNMLKPAEIEETAKAYHTKAEIIPGVAHNSMLEQNWRMAADRILSWLNKYELHNNGEEIIKEVSVA
jgi:pimeloyl-ACP methyl ester carboxylesterase